MSPKANKSPAEGERRKTAISENSFKKPARPLTAYHLFFQLEREYILQTTRATGDPNDDSARPQVDDRPIGKEIDPAMSYRYRYIRLSPKWYYSGSGKHTEGGVKKRNHRRTHGKNGFLDLSKRIAERWADLEEDDRATKEYVTRIAGRELEACQRAAKNHKNKKKVSADLKADSMDVDEMKRWIKQAGSTSQDGMSTKTALAAVAANDPITIDATTKAQASEPSSISQQARSSSDPMLEALSSRTTKNSHIAAATSSESKTISRPSYERGASSDIYSRATVSSQARSCGRSQGDFLKPLAFEATMNVTPADTKKSVRPSGKRQASTPTELDLCDESFFEPVPVERATGQVSSNISPLLNGSGRMCDAVNTPIAVMMGNGSASSDSAHANLECLKTSLALHQRFLRQQQVILNDFIQNKSVQNNSLMPSEMGVFPKEEIIPQEKIVREKSYLETMTLSGPSALSGEDAAREKANLSSGGGNDPTKGEVSAQDFTEFIDELDEAIDAHGICNGSGPSFLFGKPAFDTPGPNFGDKPASPPQTTVPMPAGTRLKNHRARMA